MKILAIETSCDETAISILEFNNPNRPTWTLGVQVDVQVSGKVFSHIVSSQIALHAPFGGVVPNIAKREHQKNLIPLLKQALEESGLISQGQTFRVPEGLAFKCDSILEREPELLTQTKEFLQIMSTSSVDIISVTNGPGLEPALWVGVNFAKALATAWQKPLIPINHMEGHLFSALLSSQSRAFEIRNLEFPAIGLLISGGHTELILIKDYLQYELLGQTRDDAIGEAFDKVARLLGLPYPGGPEISKLAEQFESHKGQTFGIPEGLTFVFPRPMIDSPDLDFSFSGLKTAVKYLIEKLPKPLSEETKTEIAHEFEEAVTEVIVSKTQKALEQTGAKALLVGGGVIANKRIREALGHSVSKLGITLHLPEPWLTGDNATMIAVAAYFRHKAGQQLSSNSIEFNHLKANGVLQLSN